MAPREPLPLLFRLLASLPLAWMLWQALRPAGWADPVGQGLRALGLWALVFLLASLAVTPLRQLTGAQMVHPLRRLAGLASFGYASLHLAAYLFLDQGGDWQAIGQDILRHRRIIAGLLCWALLLPLALTSHPRGQRLLGSRRWQSLHRLSYVAAILAVLHYAWLVKADRLWPLIAALILTLLLVYRIISHLREKRRRNTFAPPRIPS